MCSVLAFGTLFGLGFFKDGTYEIQAGGVLHNGKLLLY
jgi:hypothetical protein